MLVQRPGAQVKIEVTPVMRGCVFPPEERDVMQSVEERFGYARTPLVSFPDLYAGKLVAALDRQHPRDLFDVRLLLANEGISDELRRAFLVYLISHGRAIADVIDSHPKDLTASYRSEFAGMSPDHAVTIRNLEQTRAQVFKELVVGMPLEHKQFLLSFKRGEPEWELVALRGASELPAVLWKVHNLARLTPSRRAEAAERLERVLT